MHYFFGDLVTPGGFGLFRWLHGFADIICLPVIVPLAICLTIAILKIIPSTVNYTVFTLLFLIPLAAIRSMTMNSSPTPISLVLVPVLWIAQAVGIPFFAGCIRRNPRWYVIIPLAICIGAQPLAAVTSWWAFFSHQNTMGFGLLFVSMVPAVITCAGKVKENEKRERVKEKMEDAVSEA